MKRLACLSAFAGAVWLAAGLATASPSQYCYRTEPINVDGKLDEKAWQDVPAFAFHDIATGQTPPLATSAKILWDDQYLYIGFEAADTNVWATLDPKMGNPTDFSDLAKRQQFIMIRDAFFKVILDPDADGNDYVELHINPLNAVNDAWVEHGSASKIRQVGIDGNNVHFDWHCAGLRTAVSVDGTLNKPGDIDKGWSAEIAIPWRALAPFTRGECPPAPGDVWRAHLGRIYRATDGAERSYWTWPVIGVLDCHQPGRWGYVVFSDERAIRRPVPPLAAGDAKLKWRMVWRWTMNDKPPAEIVAATKSLGFNALGTNDANTVIACHAAGLQAIGVVWFGSPPKAFAQEALPPSPELTGWQNPAKDLYQGGGEPVQGGEELAGPGAPWCLDRPEALAYGKKMIDDLLAKGCDGIALDSIGYRNYTGCLCATSRAKQEEFCAKHPDLPPQQALFRRSQQCLVEFIDELVRCAKQRKPNCVVTCHIYPDFAPNPLYGNLTTVDYCGQTVSWFFRPHWGMDKIARYVYEVRQPGRCGSGTPFIGIFNLPPDERHKRTPQRIREEICCVKASGATSIMFAELGNILSDPAIADVVREELTDGVKSAGQNGK